MKKIERFKPKQKTLNGPRFNGRAAIDAMYKTREWISFSKRFLETNPRCYSCGKASEVTDHLIPHKGEVKLFEQFDNFIPLCCTCHNVVTAKFDRYGASKVTQKIEWLVRNRERNDLTFKVKVIHYRG